MAAAPTRRHVRPIAALTVGHAVDDLYQGAVPAIIPFLVAERHYTYAAAAGITLAATVLSSLAQPAFGILTDRRQLGWLVPAGMTIAGIGVGLSGLSSSYLLTWLAIALSGLGVAAYHPAASCAARAAAGGSARGMSWFALGGTAGFAVAPVVVTPLLDTGGLSATAWLAVPGLLAGVAITAGHRRASGAATTTAPAAGSCAQVDDWRAFGWLTGVVMCRSVCFVGLSSFLALYVSRHLGATPAGGGAALTAFLAGGAAGTLLGGWLADRYGRLPAIRTGYLLTLFGLAGLLTVPDLALAYPAAALLGLAIFIPFSVQVTLGQEYLPSRVGTASGLTLGLAVSVGGVIAPLLGCLADHAGLPVALAVLLVLPIAALLLSTQLNRDPATSLPTGGSATTTR